MITIKTNHGDISVELFEDKAPISCENFRQYASDGHYDGTVFHRVIPNFMIQGGGMDENMSDKPTRAPIKNEADNGLKNARGTIAMARTGDPHSATNQFFINTVDNTFLNHTGKNPRGWGYCVFGTVVDGMDVMDRIATAPTGAGGRFQKDVPQATIMIEKVTVIEEAAKNE